MKTIILLTFTLGLVSFTKNTNCHVVQKDLLVFMDMLCEQYTGLTHCGCNPFFLKDTLIKNPSIYTVANFNEADINCVEQQIRNSSSHMLQKIFNYSAKELKNKTRNEMVFFVVFSVDKQKAILFTNLNGVTAIDYYLKDKSKKWVKS